MSEDRVEKILPLAAGALDPAEEQSLRAELSAGGPAVEGAMAEAQGVLARLSATVDPVAPSSALKERLMDRVKAGAKAVESPATQRRATAVPPARRIGFRMAIAALIGAIMVGLPSGYLIWDTRHQNQQLRVALNVQTDQTQEATRMMGSSGVRFTALHGPDNSDPRPRGRVVWDVEHRKWRLYIFDMNPPPRGRVYQLWAIDTKQNKMPMPTFTVDSSGRAVVDAELPANEPALAAAAITDEPAGGSAQPTGSIRLVGKLD